MITIDQDELCKSCDRDRDRCGGSGCDEARENYIEDHGLNEDEPQVFGDLRRGDSIYVIYEEKLTKVKIESISEDADGFHVHPEGFSGSYLKNDSSVNEIKTWFVSKSAAVKEYTERMNRKMQSMMKNIIEFEKIK